MAANSLEYNVERVLIDLFKAQPGIPGGFSVVHYDEDTGAAHNRLVIKADEKDTRAEGCKPTLVEVLAEFRMTERDAALLDGLFKTLTRAIEDPSIAAPLSLRELFVFWVPVRENDNERENKDKARTRARKFQVLVKEKA